MKKGSPSYGQNDQLVQSWGLVHSGFNLVGKGEEPWHLGKITLAAPLGRIEMHITPNHFSCYWCSWLKR
jgi:hypothetical protein